MSPDERDANGALASDQDAQDRSGGPRKGISPAASARDTTQTDADATPARQHYDRAIEHHDEGRLARAISEYSEAIRLDPHLSAGYHGRGVARAESGKYTEAIADYNRAIELDSQQPAPFDDLAWLRATCPVEQHRDARAALAAARRACELTEWKEWGCLVTMAAAQAEAGAFEQAVHWQR